MTGNITGTIVGLTLVVSGTAFTDAQINPYTDTGTKLEIASQSIIEEAGENRVELSKAEPAVTFKKWNGEAGMTVKYGKVVAEGNRPFLSNKVEWKNVKEEVHAYPLGAKEGMEDGGFEIEIVLNERPDTNIFNFTINGAENLDFFYQPALTQQEIDEGAFRPENVVGSYAVYHKTKANHRVGSTNYATGKAYHIYRPKAIDANGVETWAELTYVNSQLSVIVPLSFLENATYPVKVDPTFGYTTLGATSETSQWYSQGLISSNRLVGRAFVLTEAGTLNSISLSVDADGSDTLTMSAALYREDSGGSGSHGKVVAIEKSGVSVSTTEKFETFTAASESLSADTYIIAGIGDELTLSGGTEVRPMKDTGATDNVYGEVGAYATRLAEDPWTETAQASDQVYSIYATYTATGGGDAISTHKTVVPQDYKVVVPADYKVIIK